MPDKPAQISLTEWETRHALLRQQGLVERPFGGSLSRHFETGGDLRLRSLRFDNSPAALQLWNFLLTEEERLHQARAQQKKLVGVMKDLGTIPVIAYALPELVAFYPDGAWWIPCVMEFSDGLLQVADSLGIDESFCPVRAMLGAFLTEAHFPKPDLLTCSVGAVCDDFSCIAQRLNGLGYPILWWEIPHRREVSTGEPAVVLPDGRALALNQVHLVTHELGRIKEALCALAGHSLSVESLAQGIQRANQVRRLLIQLRERVFMANPCPLPALELLIAEMLAIHFCSDQEACLVVLQDLLAEVQQRIRRQEGFFPDQPARIYWLNPVADLRVMNLVEECGGRICGTDNMFCHALDMIPENLPPWQALACTALLDPMVGTARERGERVCREMRQNQCEALVISRIPGASHCAWEGAIIGRLVEQQLGLPVLEIEVPPMVDSFSASLCSRFEALVETIKNRRLG